MKILLLILLMSVSLTSVTAQTPAELKRMADEYYRWRNQNLPTASSDMGLHTWDDKLTDYALSAVLARRLYVTDLLNKVRRMPATSWSMPSVLSLFRNLYQVVRLSFQPVLA